MTHLTIKQSSVIALINQIITFVAAFGIINSEQTGIIVAVSASVVNAAFLVANAVHALAVAHATNSTNS